MFAVKSKFGISWEEDSEHHFGGWELADYIKFIFVNFALVYFCICDAIQQKVHKVAKLVFPNAVEIGR